MPYKYRSSPCSALSPHKHECRQCEVRKVSMCAAVNNDELARIESLVTHVMSEPGKTLFYEGDPRDFHYNVSDGVVRLVKLLPDGRRQITGFLFPGDHLGIAAHDTYSYSAEAVTDVHLCRFRTADLEALFEDLPDLALRLFYMAKDELMAAQEQIMLLGRKNPTEKLISFLLLMSERNVDRGLPPSPVLLPMRRTDIADYLGLTVETISRTFSRLKGKGVLSLPTAETVVLEKLDLLEEMTGGD